jgi:hypothetical protein
MVYDMTWYIWYMIWYDMIWHYMVSSYLSILCAITSNHMEGWVVPTWVRILSLIEDTYLCREKNSDTPKSILHKSLYQLSYEVNICRSCWPSLHFLVIWPLYFWHHFRSFINFLWFLIYIWQISSSGLHYVYIGENSRQSVLQQK